MKDYRIDIDILKGISIIAVVLYHIGILPYGYLGVDTFFVINGFLLVPTIIKGLRDGSFTFYSWFIKRLVRFMPLVLIASVISLLLGYFCMLPDDYENLSESVFASCFFSNNILSAITTKNYWDVVNEFKPLMHLWFLGVLIQFYFVFPLVLLVIKKIVKFISPTNQFNTILENSVFAIGILSFILYLIPGIPASDKFYFVQYRIWEFCAGGFLAIKIKKSDFEIANFQSYIMFISLISILLLFPKGLSDIDNITIIGEEKGSLISISKEVLLIIVVFITCILLYKKKSTNIGLRLSVIANIGRLSLSIFVWHQIILAFLRYSCIEKFNFYGLLLYFFILTIFTYISYFVIERKMVVKTLKNYIILIISFFFIVGSSFGIYRNAGVVRDVPELNISRKNPFASRNTEYTDRIYKLDKDFSTNHNIKVLVVGNSFARDFAAVLCEWNKSNLLDITYKYDFGNEKNLDKRFLECDYLFCFGPKYEVPYFVWDNIKKTCKVYGIGTKSYGKTFGLIYSKRNTSQYYNSTIPVHPKLRQINDQWKRSWGGNYIDFVENSLDAKGEIKLFTDNNKIISFDCRHLTRSGALYYSKKFNFSKIFNI